LTFLLTVTFTLGVGFVIGLLVGRSMRKKG